MVIIEVSIIQKMDLENLVSLILLILTEKIHVFEILVKNFIIYKGTNDSEALIYIGS